MFGCEEEPLETTRGENNTRKKNETKEGTSNRQILKLLNTCHYISAWNGFQNYFVFFSVLDFYKMEDDSFSTGG